MTGDEQEIAARVMGVRGIAAYQETWPPFFEWQQQGAVFVLVRIDVTTGEDGRVRARPIALRTGA
jgi:hypothetical protein